MKCRGVPRSTLQWASAPFKNGQSVRWFSGISFTRPLRRAVFTSSEVADMLGSDSPTKQGLGSIQMSLFEDPTGGLSSGPAEELTTSEIEAMMREKIAVYSRTTYYILYTSLVDLVYLLIKVEGRSPSSVDQGWAQVFSTYFSDGSTLVKDPLFMSRAMGETKWNLFVHELDSYCTEIEEVMPLLRTVNKYKLDKEVHVPFFRQLSLDLLDPIKKKETLTALPGLILGLANGKGPSSLSLPHSQAQRSLAVSEIFLSTAEETGNTELAFLGLQLLRANGIASPFFLQKRLANVFSASARLQNDWQMRYTGQLAECLPKWMDYYKKVHLDNRKALERRVLPSEADQETRVQRDAIDAEEDLYFSRTKEDTLVSELLEANIDKAVRSKVGTDALHLGRKKKDKTVSKTKEKKKTVKVEDVSEIDEDDNNIVEISF